jgi:hypothetical protein
MKSFKEFCVDANIQEFWNPFAPKSKPAAAKPKPQTNVLAYKNYQPGVLDKASGKFTQRAHTGAEQQRYRWKPVKASVYTPGDRFTPNAVTATGDPHNWTTRNAAVPFKYPEGRAPKGKEGQPSIPYGSKLHLTAKPMGKETKVSTAKINDVGDFGRTGNVNKEVSFDLSPQMVRDVTRNRTTPVPDLARNWGKGMVYARVTPPPSSSTAKPKPKK